MLTFKACKFYQNFFKCPKYDNHEFHAIVYAKETQVRYTCYFLTSIDHFKKLFWLFWLWLNARIATTVLVAGSWILGPSCDVGLLILNDWTPHDESREFTCLVNGGHSTINYIVGSPIVWQVATHLEVIIDDTCYYAMGGDSDHNLLRLRLNINCSFVEPQHTIENKKILA